MAVETKNSNDNAQKRRRRGRKGQNSEKDFEKRGENKLTHSNSQQYRPHKSLLIHLTEQTPSWFECGRHTPGRDDTIFSIKKMSSSADKNRKVQNNPAKLTQKYRTLADQIFQQEMSLFNDSNLGGGSDERWVESTMNRGTLKDRVAAMSVVITSNPVHKLHALDMLLNLAGVSTSDMKGASQPNARVSQMAAEALVDLFTNTLIPSNRKLFNLDSRPLFLYENDNDQTNKPSNKEKKSKKEKASTDSQKTLSPRVLILWRYEEMIKQKYNSFLIHYVGKTLSEASLDLNKAFALKTAANLFRDLPEGEQILLSMMVNKIGDPSRKIAAAAGHQLRQILSQHPQMVYIIAREVQQLAHRPHLSSRALYNCIVFLNQIRLSHEETNIEQPRNASKSESLPLSLIKTYFRLFEVAIKRSETNEDSKGAMRSRLLSALLTGVNRAHPYLHLEDKSMAEHVDSLYRIAHISPPAACTQALMLLFNLTIGTPTHDDNDNTEKVDVSKEESSPQKDRFYRALYTKLSDSAMLAGRQVTMFFNLVYKTMKNDSDGKRVIAFAKRLLYSALHYSSAVVAGSLFLISEVMKHQPALRQSISRNMHCLHDPLKREPRAAFTQMKTTSENTDITINEQNDDFGSLWEIALTVNHYHPSVSKFASSVGGIVYNGDPLRDFSLLPFLDKFAFRNAKSSEKISKQLRRGESIGERRKGIEGTILAKSALPMNDPSHLKNSQVNENEEFFNKFFLERLKRDEIKGIKRRKVLENNDDADDNIDVVADTNDMDLMWQSDSEEDDFAQNLAEKLMESAGNGQAHFDDEDPDFDDWSDSDEGEKGISDGDSDNDDDADIFRSNKHSDSETDSENEMPILGDDEESNFNLSSDENEVNEEPSNAEKEEKTIKRTKTSSFMDADDYDKLVSQKSRKRHKKDKN